jgi:hypothetical protein
MLSSFQSFESPFIVEIDGERYVDAIEAWVGDEIYLALLRHCDT